MSFNRKFVEMWHIPDDVMAAREDKEVMGFVLDQLRDPERFVQKVRALYAQPEAKSYDWLDFKDGRMSSGTPRRRRSPAAPSGACGASTT